MPKCSCSGLRALWWQHQSWHRFSVKPQVRCLSQTRSPMATPVAWPQPYDTHTHRPPGDSSSTPPDDQFNEYNYSIEDEEFWSRYRSVWGSTSTTEPSANNTGLQQDFVDLYEQNTYLAQDSQKTQLRKNRHQRTSSAAPRTSRTKRRGRVREGVSSRVGRQGFQGQNSYLRKTCPPEDFARANRAFWKWKIDIAETWQMLEASQIPRHDSEIYVLRDLLQAESAGDGVGGMRKRWIVMPAKKRRDLWPELMISAFRSHPRRAHEVFTATFDAKLVYSCHAQDAIHYLVKQSLSTFMPTTALRAHADELFQLLKMVLENSPRGYLKLQQSSLYFYTLLLQTPAALVDFYRLLATHGHPMHKFTILQIASRVAKSTEHKMLSVEMLQAAVSDANLDVNTPQGAALCTTILSVNKDEDDISTADTQSIATPAEMFEHLLRCGLEPNLITYTTIVRGLCARKELKAAEQVLELMVKNQSDPDAYVYGTMMNGAKLCRHVDTICHIAETACQHNINSQPLWNDFLQAIFSVMFHEARQAPNSKRPRVIPAFPLMLQAYSKLFAPTPLRVILPDVANIGGLSVAPGQETHGQEQGHGGLPGADRTQTFRGSSDSMIGRRNFFPQLAHTIQSLPQRAEETLLSPTSTTLTTMISGYIRATSEPYSVIALYSHFRRLLKAGDPVAAQLVVDQGTMVHDMVVSALCENEGMLRVALDVVGDMLRDAAGNTEAADGTNSGQHPSPSVYTWSILLNGFMFHRQIKQGERILQIMRERGAEPNLVTWNTLLAGYARLQNVKKTASTLQRLERAGFDADEFTFKAFSYLGDKASALRYLEARSIMASTGIARLGDAPIVRGGSQATMRTDNTEQLGYALRLGSRFSHGHALADSTQNELSNLEPGIEAIAKMMDKEQRDELMV